MTLLSLSIYTLIEGYEKFFKHNYHLCDFDNKKIQQSHKTLPRT